MAQSQVLQGHFIQDIMSQYGQIRPWIYLASLKEINTRSSSAMPQKQNPVLLTETRREIASSLALAMGPMIRAHNITPGMQDPKEERSNTEMVKAAVDFIKRMEEGLAHKLFRLMTPSESLLNR
ncbi:MAG: hypothetical protein ACKOGK_09910 [Betaproteobacteria bacterium]